MGGATLGSLGDTPIDLNGVTRYGAYEIGTGASWGNITNKPTPSTGTLHPGILYVLPGSASGWRTQLFLGQNKEGYFRCIYLSNPSYNTDWTYFSTGIPAFYKNYSTLDSLAEAVGGVVSTYVGDLNNLNKTCVVTVNSQTENKPFNDGFVMTVFYSAGFLFQIGVDLEGTYIKVRTKWSNTWREWKSVTLA